MNPFISPPCPKCGELISLRRLWAEPFGERLWMCSNCDTTLKFIKRHPLLLGFGSTSVMCGALIFGVSYAWWFVPTGLALSLWLRFSAVTGVEVKA